MLEGWYCRTLANQQAAQQDGTPNDPNNPIVDEESDDDSQEQQDAQGVGGAGGNNTVDYKTQYRYLKRKLKFIIYENEFFQDALRSNQRRLLKVSRDRAFLLDRLLQYEKPENTSSESDETESSDDEATKKRKLEQLANGSARGRKKKNAANMQQSQTENVSTTVNEAQATSATPAAAEKIFHVQPPEAQELMEQHQPGHMTSAEVERHLQSRQSVMELIPERASATVPTEMFSNEPSLDSESNDHLIDGSSPTHVAAEECVAMEYTT